VLLGTDSFWEGVDVIGNSLEILVIQKLPFAVPTEPLIEANIEKLTEEGHNAFFEYSVPEAALKFRQGFGRLIRSGTDIGVVINLDDRIDKKRYGQVFKRSLPVEALSFAGENNLLKSVTDFFSRFNQ
jgi:Rad3-related DNA helicase